MYFNNLYPTLQYDPTGDGIFTTVQDILTRVIVRKEVSERNVLFTKYNIMEADTPETLSVNFYGDVKYYWVLLLLNQYYDRYYEWPMTIQNLQKFIIDKYADPNAIHHYETSQKSGNTTTKIRVELADEPTATAVLNFEYEFEKNENRKSIKILHKDYLYTFITEYNALLQPTVK